MVYDLNHGVQEIGSTRYATARSLFLWKIGNNVPEYISINFLNSRLGIATRNKTNYGIVLVSRILSHRFKTYAFGTFAVFALLFVNNKRAALSLLVSSSRNVNNPRVNILRYFSNIYIYIFLILSLAVFSLNWHSCLHVPYSRSRIR